MEARILHPADAFPAGVVEATRNFYQHVKAHQQAEGFLLPRVVDDRVINHRRTVGGQGGMGI